eukprot:scaffold310_cov335-Pavlova_lutheri.AAC.49
MARHGNESNVWFCGVYKRLQPFFLDEHVQGLASQLVPPFELWQLDDTGALVHGCAHAFD